MMCWAAVVHCARLADIVDAAQYQSLLMRAKTIVSPVQPHVVGAGGMWALGEGHFLGFFEKKAIGWNIIHAMISVGTGHACGNKNDCVGVGLAVGWENLDLRRDLLWREDGDINAPLGADPKTGALHYRQVRIFHRPITDLTTL
jgi:hypothetical protein